MVRPRGWHLDERNFHVDGEPISASLFDFGLHVFNNFEHVTSTGAGLYFYLPKLEGHLEARLWNDVFVAAQTRLGIPLGTVRATVLIETITAAFEMDEILYELKDHVLGLNAGRWDYIFSVIKRMRAHPDLVLPDRDSVTMTVPFMSAYTDLLVATCHKRGAHAIGGMAAFIPNRRNPEINEIALEKVREDKEVEARKGFDGTWVAHPDLIPVARQVFDNALRDAPHQKGMLRKDVMVTAEDLLNVQVMGSTITEAGVRKNISVALQYIHAWLEGNGAVAIYNLMEDAATAEICRAQLWQWINHGSKTGNGTPITADLYMQYRAEEVEKLVGEGLTTLGRSVEMLDKLVLSPKFEEFLTLPGYSLL